MGFVKTGTGVAVFWCTDGVVCCIGTGGVVCYNDNVGFVLC